MRLACLLLPLVCVVACSRSESSGPAAGSSSAEAWTSGGVHFTQRTLRYRTLTAAMDAQPEGSIDALVAEGPGRDTMLVEITAEPAHGPGFPWSFETTFADNGATKAWGCSPQGAGRVCRALINGPALGGRVTTRLAGSPATR